MRSFLYIIIFLISAHFSNAQIFSSTAVAVGPTNYQTVSYVDSIFYYCTPISNAELTALPAAGTPNWTFVWQRFDAPTNSWVPLSTTTNAASSTITGLAPGGYRVTITDATSSIVGCYRAWIVEILTPTTVDVAPIPPGCGAVQLNGTINWGTATPYYEPPPEPMIIDATTQITVCFTATHTYVSDLGFYLVEPSVCGGSSVVLSPNPGSIGQGSICNSGDNVSNLCFTSTPAANLNICTAATPLTGTYSSYGPASTPINWSALYGCNAAQPGWAVQIYDCIGADIGSLQQASITFTGTTICGDISTIAYSSTSINSPINDNSCSQASASIFTVPPVAATPISYNTNFIWTANPPITIPNATTSLTPLVVPGPTQTTTFTLSIDTTGGNACIPAACAGNWQDSEVYIYIPPTPAILSGPATICSGDPAINFIADIPGGTWTSSGIINPIAGTFDPGTAGVGTHIIMYTVSNPCPINSFINITVVNGSSVATITNPGTQCINGSPINLTSNPSGGTWSGTGITNPSGTFDPTVTGVGTFQVDVFVPGACPANGSIMITVDTIPDATFTLPLNLCANSAPVNLVPNVPGGIWSGLGITDSINGTFDPSVSGAGSIAITYTVGTPCANSSVANVNVNALPNVNASANQSICPGDSVQITATGAITYSWSPVNTLSNSSIANPYASPSVNTIYTVTGTDANGCTDTADVLVSILTPATLVISGGNQVCENDSLLLVISNSSNVTWTPTNGVSSPNSTTTYVSPDSTITYTIIGEDVNGCTNTNSITVTVNTVEANMTVTPTTGVTPLIVDFTNNSINGVMYVWNYGDGTVDTAFTLAGSQHVYTTEGIYVVTLTVVSANGCVDQTSITIVVSPDCYLIVPNVFSPNNDNVNDRLEIICTRGITTFNMKIYDRWGRMVADFNDVNFSWDGKGQSDGTFYYVLHAEGLNNTVYDLSGYITLMR